MARIRKVTRTIVSTDAEVMTVNTETKEVGSIVVTVAGTYDLDDDKDNKALDKAVRKAFANKGLDDIVMVSITETTPVIKRYSMLEDTFTSLAECEVLAEGDLVDEDEDSEE